MLAEHNLRCCAPNQPLDPFRMATLCVIPNTGALLQLRSAVTSEASRACVGFGWNGIYFYLRRVNIFARARHDTARRADVVCRGIIEDTGVGLRPYTMDHSTTPADGP